MFILNSDITIGNFRFTGVHDIHIRHSIHTYTDTAIIRLPSIASLYTLTNSSNPEKITTSDKFNVNDQVTIKLGYNGDMKEEFRGFVKNFSLAMPLEIECEGFSYLLQKKTFNGSWTSTTVKQLLDIITAGTGISTRVADNIALSNVIFTGYTGTEVIEYIMEASGGALKIFFKQPDLLWAGLLYTAYSQGNTVLQFPTVPYKLGYNARKENSLRQKNKNDIPVQIEFNKKLSSGQIITATAGASANNNRHKQLLNNISSSATLQLLANEKQVQLNYSGYEGNINGFLPLLQSGIYGRNI
jgi:hypothetical protein